jgi:5-methylcytosine-specific restriction protein B
MRLIDITLLSQNLKESFSSITEWEEVHISEAVKKEFKQIFPIVNNLYNHTGIISKSGGKLIIFPYQYFLISVLIKPIVIIMREYKLLLEQLIFECKSKNIDIAESIFKKSKGISDSSVINFDNLITHSTFVNANIDLLVKLLTDDNYRQKAKEIANHNGGQYKMRSIEDFFGSFFLQIINVPNASSEILGEIIFKLSENSALYNKLCDELRPDLTFILKERTLNNFIYFCLLNLKSDAKLDSLLEYLIPNTDPKFYSIEKGGKKLTSIFWCFDHLATRAELEQGNRICCFEEPIFIKDTTYFYLSTEWANTGTSRLDFVTFKEIFNEIYGSIFRIQFENNTFLLLPVNKNQKISAPMNIPTTKLVSIKTKPFIILAGLSGTGKSRLVRTLAYQFNNIEADLAGKSNTLTNFQLIKVKPNWHDSSELLGYESRISGKDRFIATDFIRFIVKALQYPDTPFFLCLDEMNLAPVEQYFAEYLSAIETRRVSGSTIKTDALISSKLIAKYANKADGVDTAYEFWNELELTDKGIQDELKANGLGLPSNLIVMGTVNMDETTHSFSRKVLDRAMTIEMNDINLSEGLDAGADDWNYPAEPLQKELVLSEKTQGTEVYTALGAEVGPEIIKYLDKVNEKLEGSPFKIAYRVRDEFLLYAYNYSLLENKHADWLKIVLDEMTLMKILPRIEGDETRTQLLDDLITFFQESNLPNSLNKANEMVNRRNISHYTSFWA